MIVVGCVLCKKVVLQSIAFDRQDLRGPLNSYGFRCPNCKALSTFDQFDEETDHKRWHAFREEAAAAFAEGLDYLASGITKDSDDSVK
jgi:phage FluMu protein Com